MLPSEQRRKKNQRLIPLTEELIQDMLENEGLEYQTPPGGRLYASEDDSFARTSLAHRHRKWKTESLHLSLKSEQYEPNTSSSIDIRYNSESDSSGEDSEQEDLLASDSLDTLYSDSTIERASSSDDTESSNLQSLVDLMRSVKAKSAAGYGHGHVDTAVDVDKTQEMLAPTPNRES
ncbi:hypothetical protein AWZ03_007604 [Drosophila navojoa]|uniref:Uncharacterized protein n=1 Tax=Drosophila navojoa TaxID=7232 RepID=A0A484BBG6_DRONA|nr:hypothetical protein AWZ03_007604 [Drosophila navojoa]